MPCGFDKGLLAAYYDGETTADERVEVERHLASCPDCARDLASMKSLSSALRPLAGATAPMSIADGVIREIGAARAKRLPWKGWLMSAAAAIFLGIGTVYMLDRNAQAPLPIVNVAASDQPAPAYRHAAKLPANVPQDRNESMDQAGRLMDERKSEPAPDPGLAERPKIDMPAPPAAEAEEAGKPHLEAKTESRWKKMTVPVVRVTTPDPALVRAEVDLFLKERELRSATAGPMLLGRATFVRDRYLQIELTEEESLELEKRLAALKETVVASGSFEEEKKRVAEETARMAKKADDEMLKARPAGEGAKETEKAEADGSADMNRARAAGKDKTGVRKKVIFVLEQPAPKK